MVANSYKPQKAEARTLSLGALGQNEILNTEKRTPVEDKRPVRKS